MPDVVVVTTLMTGESPSDSMCSLLPSDPLMGVTMMAGAIPPGRSSD